MVVGEVDRKELLAVKRVGYVRSCTAVQVAFYTPEKTGRSVWVCSRQTIGIQQLKSEKGKKEGK